MQSKLILGALIVILGTACSDNSFCDCMKAGEKLNEHSNSILNGDNSEEAYTIQEELLEKKRNACKDFENTDGETLKELQEGCNSE